MAGVEEEYAAAKTSVWWDIENCQVPRGTDAHTIAQNIRGALSDAGYRGMAAVYAYGDTTRIPNSVQQALSSTGIALNHVPAGVKDASDKKILVDMLFWAVDNPPPANYLLISGDRDFSNALHQLRMRRYNILLAHSPNVSQALVAAAKCVWLWTNLVAGSSPLQSSEPPQLGSTTTGSGSGVDIPKYSNTEMKQSVDPSSESSQNRNQKIYGNAKGDGRYKVKQSWKSQPVNQPTIARNSSSEFKQPPMSTQEVLLDGIANTPYSNWITSQQQHTSTTSSAVKNTSSSTAVLSPSEMPPDPSFSIYTMDPEGNQFKEAPHNFFGYRPPTFSGPAQTNSLPRPDFSPKKINHGHDNHQTQHPPILRPSNFLSQPTMVPGNLYAANSLNHSSPSQHPRPDVPPIRSSPADVPDMSKLSISQIPGSDAHKKSQFYPGIPEPRPGVVSNPSGFSQNLHFSHSLAPPQHNGMYNNHFHCPELRPPPVAAMTGQGAVRGAWGTSGCPQPSDEALFHIGHVLNALYILKTDMMLPTEENISDCIGYRINVPNFSVSMGLDYALKHQMVVKFTLGKMSCYTGKNDRMWNCVNIMDINAKHPKTTWDKIQGFLFSPDGQSKMLSSYCRYQAAIAIKDSCLDHLPLGSVLQILNMIVIVKKWLIPHPSGWQPLSFGRSTSI